MKGEIIKSTFDNGTEMEVAVITLDVDTFVVVSQDGFMLGMCNMTKEEALDGFFEMYEKKAKIEIAE